VIPIIAGCAWRRVDTVFEVDWTNTPTGAGSVTGTGTLYERLSAQSTVQTGPTTLATGGALDNSSVPPIGKNGGLIGLVIEEARTQAIQAWREMVTPNWFDAGGGSFTHDAATSPDGTTSAERSQTTSGNPGYYCAFSHSGNQTFSYWHKAGSVGATGQAVYNAGSSVFYLVFAGSEPTNWTRNSVLSPSGGSGGPLVYMTDGTSRTAIGGIGAGARDSLLDFVNFENGNFPSEAFGPGVATRAAPRWYRNVGNTCLAEDGSLRCYIECEPKGASNEYSADMTLWYIDANNNAVIDNAVQAVKITIGGTLYTTPVSMSWSREDRLRIFVSVGGGQVTSVQYAVGASSPIRISTGSPPTFGALTISGNLDFLQSNKTKVFSVRCQRIRFYKFNKKPSDF